MLLRLVHRSFRYGLLQHLRQWRHKLLRRSRSMLRSLLKWWRLMLYPLHWLLMMYALPLLRRTMKLRTLLWSMWDMTLIFSPMTKPSVPVTITPSIGAPSLSAFVIPSGAIIRRIGPKIRIETRPREGGSISHLLVTVAAAETMATSVSHSSTASCVPCTTAIAPSSSATSSTAWACRHARTDYLRVGRADHRRLGD